MIIIIIIIIAGGQNFDERPHRREVYFSRAQWGVTPSCGSRTVMPLLRSEWPLSLHTLQQTPNAFSGGEQRQNCPGPWRGSWPHLIMVYWVKKSRPPIGNLIGSDGFAHCTAHPCDEQTDRQTTLRATSVAIGCILCTECIRWGLNRPNNEFIQFTCFVKSQTFNFQRFCQWY